MGLAAIRETLGFEVEKEEWEVGAVTWWASSEPLCWSCPTFVCLVCVLLRMSNDRS